MLGFVSRCNCASLWRWSAPLGLARAYWYGEIAGLTMGAMAWAVAVAMMRLGTVPHAIGRIFPLGFNSGITLEEATASSVAEEVWLVARRTRVRVKSWRAWLLCLTTE